MPTRSPTRDRLAEARERTGLGEAVLTGRATLDGRPLALVAGEFGFLGGSVGVATSERIARAFERAVEQRLPLVALPASGGSRMQEGTLAVVGMAKLAAAAGRLRAAGLPYVVCLTDPTTGGVLASWGSLGTVTFALPGALLGFAGPRVVELLTGVALPEGVQRAENLLAHGLIDDVVAPGELRARVGRVLAVASDTVPPPARGEGESAPPDPAERDAWASLQHARDRRRPGARELLDALASDVTELRGDRAGHPDDAACVAALARVCGHPAVVVGQRRDADGAPGAMNAAGYRKARRAMALAGELGLPLLTIVDTPGAELSAEAEQGGLAGEIAGCLAEMAALPIPTLALLIGEGGSGGALALLVADRVLVARARLARRDRPRRRLGDPLPRPRPRGRAGRNSGRRVMGFARAPASPIGSCPSHNPARSSTASARSSPPSSPPSPPAIPPSASPPAKPAGAASADLVTNQRRFCAT